MKKSIAFIIITPVLFGGDVSFRFSYQLSDSLMGLE